MVPSDGEYSYATTDVKQPVSTSPDHVPDERKTKGTGEPAVPSMTEYSYARSDSIRPTKISSDRLVVRAAVTGRREEDEKQPGYGEDPYSLKRNRRRCEMNRPSHPPMQSTPTPSRT